MNLSLYKSEPNLSGRNIGVVVLWYLANSILLSTWIPGSSWRASLLRLFGASIGIGVVIKPGVSVKYPWKLRVGNFSWIGEKSWIDNLACVDIGDSVCISQNVYICTGNHDYSVDEFTLILNQVVFDSHSWACAFSRIAPGTHFGEGAVLGFGAVGQGFLEPWTIYSEGPASKRKLRKKNRHNIATKNKKF